MKLKYLPHITRQIVQDNPTWVFLFGDNLTRRGFGGQAKEMRGEPNAVGIATKNKPCVNGADCFFTDDNYEAQILEINKDFAKIPANTEVVVIPSAGLGTGLARLNVLAPRTYKYILDKIDKLQYE